MIPATTLDAYEAARYRAGFINRTDRGRIALSGKDRASYLHGLLTNDITVLKGGEGCYAAYLTPQGRMIADMLVYELGDLMLLTLASDVKDTVLAMLDKFVFTEDVQVGDLTDTFTSVAVVGPQAARIAGAVLADVSVDVLAALPEHGNVRGQFEGRPAIAVRVTDTGEAGYELFVDASRGAALNAALGEAGAIEVDDATADALRVEAGVPKFRRDMDEHTIPLEAGIESRAISLTKGCYVGQEVIIRVLHRGHGRVVRKLVGLAFEGDSIPARDAIVRADDREVGHVTSSVLSPALKRPIALAYLHRDFVAAGTNVTVDGAPAVVTELPFLGRQR